MSHVITVRRWNSGFALLCSCSIGWGKTLAEFELTSTPALDELNKIAHEHIEAAEADPGYRVESAIRSEDELVDLTNEQYVRRPKNMPCTVDPVYDHDGSFIETDLTDGSAYAARLTEIRDRLAPPHYGLG